MNTIITDSVWQDDAAAEERTANNMGGAQFKDGVLAVHPARNEKAKLRQVEAKTS
ncbi:MAG: hypothetical protein P8Z30_13545 [Acidobacteriota bacterium]